MTASSLTDSGVIAAATVAYVIATVFLWWATNKTAQAANQSANIAAELHRPYIGVTVFVRKNDFNADGWWLEWEIKNFGTLPAAEVSTEVEVLVNNADRRWHFPQSAWVEVFPLHSVSDGHEIQTGGTFRNSLSQGDTRLSARIQVHYLAPGHRRYRHTVMAVYERDRQNFRLENSRTEQVGD